MQIAKLKAIVIGLAALLIAATSWAQPSTYPNRPVKMVAPFAPGGPVDVVARVLAPKLSEGLGQHFYVENHPGGSGNIGTALVAKAPPDGYTVLVISSTLVVNPSLFAKLGFDTTTDLAPVSLVGVSPQVLLVHPSVPAASVKELIAWVKARPGEHSYAHAGLGTPGYLAGEMFKQAFGLDLVAVAFNGGGPAITSTIGGHTPILYTSISTAAGHIKQGTVRALAVRCAGTARHTAGGHRSFASRDRQDYRAAGDTRAPLRARLRADRQHARGIRRSDQMGNRQMGEGHSHRRHQGAVK